MIRHSAVSIPRRDIDFGIDQVSCPDWFAGDPLRSAYADALSMCLPLGERFFITAVRHYLPEIDDPELVREIKAFMAQEALHTREHEAYNDALRRLGYPVERMEARVRAELAGVAAPLRRLAFTAANEHLTATLAHLVLRNPDLLENALAPYRELWTWHCLEEMEHKGVAYDVLLRVTHDRSPPERYLLRCATLLVATIDIHRILFVNAIDILRSRGKQTGIRAWARALWQMFGRPGTYRRALPYYLRYFMPGFHPWKGDDAECARAWRDHFNSRAGLPPDA